MSVKHQDKCFHNAAYDEELFTLRAQDTSAPLVVLEWIKLNFETAPKDKLQEAFDCALRMREHDGRKVAD